MRLAWADSARWNALTNRSDLYIAVTMESFISEVCPALGLEDLRHAHRWIVWALVQLVLEAVHGLQECPAIAAQVLAGQVDHPQHAAGHEVRPDRFQHRLRRLVEPEIERGERHDGLGVALEVGVHGLRGVALDDLGDPAL